MIAGILFYFVGIGAIVSLFILWIHFPPAKIKGRIGENYISRLLSKLPVNDYTIFNDLLIPYGNRTSQIDHVVVSPYGVFVIETKNFRGWIFGGQYSEHWTQNIWGNRYKMPNPIAQNAGHIKALQYFLKQENIQYVSIIAFSGRASLKINAPLCNVIYYNQILNVISRYTDVVLDSDSLSQINHQLRSIPKATKNDKQQHIQKVKEVIMKNETAVLNRKCPRCGGQLVCRNGKYGSFYGCSNYPYCKYTFNG